MNVTVPLLDLKLQYESLRAKIGEAIERVCASQRFIMGPELTSFESEIADYVGARFGIGVSSGTDALLVALMTLGVGPGDEVITTTYSFFATAGVIVRVGARPVFVDIDPDTFNLDPAMVCDRMTDRTRAIIPVHLFGRCAELEGVADQARNHGIAIIEDAAQAIGATDAAGLRAGSVGEMGCFSFFPSKNLGAFGDGGMVVTSDEDLADRARVLRVHGAKPKYHHQLVGGNFRLDALQAAILRVKLPKLDAWTSLRRENANRYRTLFAQAGLNGEVALPMDVPGHIYNQFVIRCRDRDGLREQLTAEGIGSEVYYPIPLHRQKCFADLGCGKTSLPHAERAARETLALPIFPELTLRQQEYVVETIAGYLSRRRA